MATLLWVENAKPFQLGVILLKIRESLKFILRLTNTPDLMGTKLWKPEEILSDSYYFDLGGDDIGIKICGENALVSVSPASNREAICVSPDYSRTKLEYALAAAVVIAIGDYSEAQISDHALAYTNMSILPAKEFARRIRVVGGFVDINEASEDFFSHLPMSPE